jgi:hypothetical protein
MTNERFNAIWEPRVGTEATRLIRRRAWLVLSRLAASPVIILLAITLDSPLYYIVTFPLLGIYLIGVLLLMRRTNRRLAAALTRHLGVEITPQTLPPVRRAELFDRAVSSLREGRPGRKRSFFGGFIRIERP